MADRHHDRGPHPADASLFCESALPRLQQATDHLSWLLTRGYAAPSSLKLVGDRFNLVTRQRTAVARSACSDTAVSDRASRLVTPESMRDRDLEIDTFNVLITLEAALSGGVVLLARDGAYRDMASMHGSYRRVSQTHRAIECLVTFLSRRAVGQVLFRIDRPVSNSGRLGQWLTDHARQRGLRWEVCLDNNPDPLLGTRHDLVATADSVVLDTVGPWANLARWIIDEQVSQAWIVAMSSQQLEP